MGTSRVGRARVGIGALLAPLVLVVAGCAAPPPSPAAGATAAPPSTQAADYRSVEFPARDGEVRTGRVFGAGPVAVVLSHMGRPGDGQDDWAGYAGELAGLGVRTLTYEGRRLGMENVWKDVLGRWTTSSRPAPSGSCWVRSAMTEFVQRVAAAPTAC